jgi:hypothetical protein
MSATDEGKWVDSEVWEEEIEGEDIPDSEWERDPSGVEILRYRPKTERFNLGRPAIENDGVFSVARYPIPPGKMIGKATFVRDMELKIWDDPEGRYSFRWEAHNKSRHAKIEVKFHVNWFYKTSGHDPVRDLDILYADIFEISHSKKTGRTRRRYHKPVIGRFALLDRADIDAILKVSAIRTD